MMLDSVQQRRRDLHQGVVGHLLLLATRVAVVQVVHLVCHLCEKELDEREERGRTGEKRSY